MNESNGRRPETTARIALRTIDPNDPFTPGPQEIQRIARGFRKLYLWPLIAVIPLLGGVAGGAVWLYRLEEHLRQIDGVIATTAKQDREIRGIEWTLYRMCLTGGGKAADCRRPEDAP